jgi:hypothetical protein
MQVHEPGVSIRRNDIMPSKKTVKRARQDLRQGKKPSTAAGEFVKEEFDHIRQGKHGARSTKQAIAIGLSKARRAGVPLKPPARGTVPERTRKSAVRAYEVGQKHSPHAPSPRRSQASLRTLRREGRAAGTRRAISNQVRASARKIRRRTAM